MKIEEVNNGFIVTDVYGKQDVYLTLDKVFDALLQYYEGRAEEFTGRLYGRVIIEREASNEPRKEKEE